MLIRVQNQKQLIEAEHIWIDDKSLYIQDDWCLQIYATTQHADAAFEKIASQAGMGTPVILIPSKESMIIECPVTVQHIDKAVLGKDITVIITPEGMVPVHCMDCANTQCRTIGIPNCPIKVTKGDRRNVRHD